MYFQQQQKWRLLCLGLATALLRHALEHRHRTHGLAEVRDRASAMARSFAVQRQASIYRDDPGRYPWNLETCQNCDNNVFVLYSWHSSYWHCRQNVQNTGENWFFRVLALPYGAFCLSWDTPSFCIFLPKTTKIHDSKTSELEDWSYATDPDSGRQTSIWEEL